MIALVLSIISATLIFVIFRWLSDIKLEVFQTVIINYFFAFIAALVAFIIQNDHSLVIPLDWFPVGIVVGILFVFMFFVMGKSSQKAGVGPTSVASKVSVVIPVAFSIYFDPADELTIQKGIGIFIAIIAIFLTLYKPNMKSMRKAEVIFPLLLFFGVGSIDSLLKYAQAEIIMDKPIALFTLLLFGVSSLTGLLFGIVRRTPFSSFIAPRQVGAGFLLGIVNWGAIFFLVQALDQSSLKNNWLDGSEIFGINNLGIVLLSALGGWVLFKEHLLIINRIGIVLAMLALLFLSGYQ
ncbi:MAG: hypothetical protein ACOC3T_03675 [Bacteroidota bacterium]